MFDLDLQQTEGVDGIELSLLESIYDHIGSAILIVSVEENPRILYANASTKKLLSRTLNNLKEMNPLELFSDESRECVEAFWSLAIEFGHQTKNDVIIQKRSGRKLNVLLVCQVTRLVDRSQVFVMTLHDVTYLKEIENKLREINLNLVNEVQERTAQLACQRARVENAERLAAIGEMAAGIAHEISNPLAIIDGYNTVMSEITAEQPVKVNELLKLQKKVGTTVQRIVKIIEGLVVLGRDSSKDSLEWVPVNYVLENVFAFCAENFRISGVRLSQSGFLDRFEIKCIPGQICQVLLNLLSNAKDASRESPDPWVMVEAQQVEERIEISITNSGNLIPSEIRKKLFLPFFSTKPVGRGTGLGLSVAKGIMNANQGSLYLDESSVNTRFVITLPVSVAQKEYSK